MQCTFQLPSISFSASEQSAVLLSISSSSTGPCSQFPPNDHLARPTVDHWVINCQSSPVVLYWDVSLFMHTWNRVDGLTPIAVLNYLLDAPSCDIGVNPQWDTGSYPRLYDAWYVVPLVQSVNQHATAIFWSYSSSSLKQVFFTLIRTSVLFPSEGTKTMFSFKLNLASSPPRTPKQCSTNISTAPLVQTLFSSVITNPTQPSMLAESIKILMEHCPYLEAKFTSFSTASNSATLMWFCSIFLESTSAETWEQQIPRWGHISIQCK